MIKAGAIYIMTNANNTTLYVGVTSELKNRIYKHKTNFYPDSFTSKYKLYKLVYYEGFFDIEQAIAREKQLKAGPRKKKVALINGMNPGWKDLYEDL